MPTIEEHLQKKKPFKKKEYRSYLAINETLSDLDQPGQNPVTTEVQPGQNPVTTEVQPGQNPVTTEVQPGQNPVTTEVQPGQNPVTEILCKIDNPVTTRLSTRLNFSKNSPKTESSPNQNCRDYRTLVGNDEKVMLALFAMAQENGSNQTIYFSRQKLSKEITLSYESVRTAIKRLKDFGILESVTSTKGGPGSITKVSFPQSTYRSLCLDALKKRSINSIITEAQPGYQPGQTLSSSSSINVLENLKTTTTGETEKLNLTEEWESIDFSSISDIGFSKNHLTQIAQQGRLTPEQVKDSINAFAFDLKKNQKAKSIHGSPLGFFMGILRKGCPYAPPENYESPEDEALRKYLEAKRTQLARRKAMEQELMALEFTEWSETLSDEERKQYAPHAKIDRSDMQIAELKDYFSKHVYTRRERSTTVSDEAMRTSVRQQIEQSLGPISSG